MARPDEVPLGSIHETWLRLAIDILHRNRELVDDAEPHMVRFLDGQVEYFEEQYLEWHRTGTISNHLFISALNYLRAFRDSYTREWAHARGDHHDGMRACVTFTVA